jgi:putative ABC transport system permease protein
MNNAAQIIGTSIIQALQELRVNKLRTFLSLLGITIGIFCIIAVLTALDSAQGMIQKRVNTLGSDVLHIERWPWPGVEEGEYKWWEYWRRPNMTKNDLSAISAQLHDMAITTLCLPVRNLTLKYDNREVSNIRAYSVTSDFDKTQTIDLTMGRYLSTSELEGGNNCVILGDNAYTGLERHQPVRQSHKPAGKKIPGNRHSQKIEPGYGWLRPRQQRYNTLQLYHVGNRRKVERI